MSFPRYPAYKDSGVPWLGEVPTHWDICALKRIADLKSGESITAEDIEDEGDYPVFGGNGLRGFTSRYTHEGTYALVGRQGALCGNVNYATGKFWASEHAVVAAPTVELKTRWLGELMRAMNLNQYSVSAAQPGLSVEAVGNLRIPVPPIHEQSAITSFLDHEAAKIDALVAEQEKLIALLKEKLQAVISQAVTKGLDPTVPMRDSGVEWLGEVPAHWELKRLKYLGEAITGLTYSPADIVEGGASGTLVLRSSNVQGGVIAFDDNVYVSAAIPEELVTQVGDILICSRNGSRALIGKNATIDESASGLTFGAFMTVFRSQHSAYIACVLNSPLFEFQSGAFMTSTINQLTIGVLNNFEVPLPPENERADIAAFLALESAKFNTLTTEAQRAIDLLQERRTALISAAVTGQIDVRTAVKEPA
ncbi:MAG: restriction endonuclease subunit S [Hylemonella sp.]|nr:restriction endonuclease subunit S [Hylemonella sp.]